MAHCSTCLRVVLAGRAGGAQAQAKTDAATDSRGVVALCSATRGRSPGAMTSAVVQAHLDADGCELRWGLLPLRIRQIVGGEGE